MPPVSLGSAIYTVTLSYIGLQQLAQIPKLLDDVKEAYLRAERASSALSKTFGQQAAAFEGSAKRLADAIKVSNREAQEQITIFGTLANNYGFTSSQIEILSQRSADLAATSGKDLVDAAQRVQSAMRLEGESAEQLGLTLNSDAVKATARMTDEQRKNWESLDQVTKAQIIFNEFLRQSAFAQGAATEAAKKSTSAYREQEAALEKLSVTVGRLLAPAMENTARQVAGVATESNKLLLSFEDLSTGGRGDLIATVQDIGTSMRRLGEVFPPVTGGGVLIGQTLEEITLRADQAAKGANSFAESLNIPQPFLTDTQEASRRMVELGAATNQMVGLVSQVENKVRGGALGTLAEQLKAAAREGQELARTFELMGESDAFSRQTANIKATTAAAEQLNKELDEAYLEGQRLAASIEDDAEKLARRQDVLTGVAGYGPTLEEQTRDAERAARESARTLVEARREGLRQQRDAERQAFAESIRLAERERDAKRAILRQQLDDALAAIETEQEAERRAREEQDRTLEDSRRLEDRAREARLSDALETLDRRHDAQQKGIDAERQSIERARDADLAALDERAEAARERFETVLNAIERERDRAQAYHERTMANLQDEQEAARKTFDARVDELENAADAERKRSDEALKHIERERDRLDAAHDKAIAGLDRRMAREDRRHDRAIAHLDQEEARLRGPLDARLAALDAEEKAERRRETDRRLREQLQQANLSQDPERVAEALRAIEEERAQRARDDERATLEAQLAAIEAEFNARRDAEDRRAERARERIAEQRAAEDEAHKAALKALDERAEKERARFDAALAALQQEKEATQAAFEAQQEAFAAREEEENAANERRIASLDARAEAESARLETTLENIETEREALQEAADEDLTALDERAERVKETYDARKTAIQETYDAETTAIDDLRRTQDRALKDQRTAEDIAFKARQVQAKETYDAELLAIYAVYDGEGGLIPRLRAASEATDTELGTQEHRWADWATEINKQIDSAKENLEELLRLQDEIDDADNDDDAPSRPSSHAIPRKDPPKVVVGGEVPRRALGGPVDAHRDYWVGEQGPELFRPAVAGTVIPNHTLAALDRSAALAAPHAPPSTVYGASYFQFYAPLNVNARGGFRDTLDDVSRLYGRRG